MDITAFLGSNPAACNKCHVEYYFKGDGKYHSSPWQDGTRNEEIANYFAELQFTLWEHPGSGTNLTPQAELNAVQATGTPDIIQAETN